MPVRPAPYLTRLTHRLAAGLESAPADFCDRHARYLMGKQNADGGFSGREGGSDLYYTAFALRGLAVLRRLEQPAIGQAADFLRGCLLRPATVVDFMSLLYAARLVAATGGPDVLAEQQSQWPDRVAGALESFRKSDGGYGKAVDGAAGSTYHTFLVALCYELIDRPLPDAAGVIQFLRQRRRDDGGFVEVAPARRGGTNPTAAAIATLGICNDLDDTCAGGAVQFLGSVQALDGGLRANERAPLADLLSTFTGLLTLCDLGAADRIDCNAVREFVAAADCAAGGFRGGVWDEASDVEYTFYGLGATALLHR